MKRYLLALLLLFPCSLIAHLENVVKLATEEEQFVLFDETFTFTKFDADNSKPSKSHYYVTDDKLNPNRPRDWSSPVDFRNGSVHIRIEVIDKPAGGAPTKWTLCYIPNKGQGNGYGCTSTSLYGEEGIYESDISMTSFWENESIVWSEGIKRMDLVIKDDSGGQGHAHKRTDHEKFFPTRVRILMVQVAAGATYNPMLVPTLNKKAAMTYRSSSEGTTGHFLYVATPGIRNYLGYGGHGLLVFDIDNNHKFVKRIPTRGFKKDGTPSNVKGIAVSQQLNSVFISTLEALQRIDLETEELVWEIPFEGGCDRMSISPDGMSMYLPSLEKDFWNVINCETGKILAKIKVHSRAHNTIYGPSGKWAYMADIGSPLLHVADTKTHTVDRKIGPFSAGIRPFTINSDESLVFVNVNELLGFEVGDLKTGEKLASIKVLGWDKGPVRRHGNPSHGIGLTPDETEIWISDGHNMRLHVFSAKAPYQQLTTIPLSDMPGWVTFSIDGKYAYPSSGEVIHSKTREVLYMLKDEHYNTVSSEKMIELFMKDGKVVKKGDQFGLGRGK